MKKEVVRVIFADQTMESEYRDLSGSSNWEDGRLHSVLTHIRGRLLRSWKRGKNITGTRLGMLYGRLFEVSNVWRLDLPAGEIVVYSVVPPDVRILDIQ